MKENDHTPENPATKQKEHNHDKQPQNHYIYLVVYSFEKIKETEHKRSFQK